MTVGQLKRNLANAMDYWTVEVRLSKDSRIPLAPVSRAGITTVSEDSYDWRKYEDPAVCQSGMETTVFLVIPEELDD